MNWMERLMSDEPGRWKLSDLRTMLDDGEGPVMNELSKIADLLENEGNKNFILGKVIIENDLHKDEESDND
jgi:hypothetical protein